MRTILTLLISILSLAGCGGEGERLPEHVLTGQTMGTSYSIKLIDPPASVDRERLAQAIRARLETVETRFSTYMPASELSRINTTMSAAWIPVSEELCAVVESAIAISRRTNGAFDITVGPLVLLWGFGPESDRSVPPGDELVAEARSSVGYEKLDTDCTVPALRKALPSVYIDLSAYAKGYAVDRLAELLDERGLVDYLIEIGGELFMRGHNAQKELWAIAVEKPADAKREVQSVVHITDSGMATSGDYRNFYVHDGVRYSHTIDPETGRPVTHNAAAVTVISETAAEADALATALLVMGPDKGMMFAAQERIAAYFLLRTDRGIEQRTTGEFAALLNR